MSDKPKGVYCPKFEKGFWAGWDEHAKCSDAEIPPLRAALREVVLYDDRRLELDPDYFRHDRYREKVYLNCKAALAQTPSPTTEGSEDRG